MKSTLAAELLKTESVVLEFERDTSALLARVLPARKVIALVLGGKMSDGNTASSPFAPTFATVKFAEIATAPTGMPHADAAGSNVRVAPGCNDGPPSGPVRFLVSRTRHGGNVWNMAAEPAGATVTVAFPGALTHPEAFVSVTESVNGVPAVPPVKVIWLVAWPDVIVPFPIVHEYVEPA